MLASVLFGMLCVLKGYAQDGPPAITQPPKAEVKTEKSVPSFFCPKCGHAEAQAGKCAVHQVSLIKADTYYCRMHTGEVSEKPANCSKCNMAMLKMTRKIPMTRPVEVTPAPAKEQPADKK